MIALVVGSAPKMQADLAGLAGIRFDRTYAANWAAMMVGCDVWVSGHPEKMPEWQPMYREKFGTLPEIVVTAQRMERVEGDAVFDRIIDHAEFGLKRNRFDSGLAAVQVAMMDEAERVVVAGVALDASGNLNDWTPRGHSYAHYRRSWAIAHTEQWRGRVRACSGWPAQFLGRPDPAWLGVAA